MGKSSTTPRTAFAFGGMRLRALCEAAGLSDGGEQIVGLFSDLSGLCHDRDSESPPRWSGVTDDCTPFEFSIAIRQGGPNIRILVEAQDDPASPQSYWDAGSNLNQWINRNWSVKLRRFHQIEDLFVPRDPSAYWSMWHGVDFRVDGPPLFKIYMNPAAQGTGRSEAVVSEALGRLGFGRVWSALLDFRGPKDRFSHFSLDLARGSEARVKIYIRHYLATLDELEARCAAVYGTSGDDWSDFSRAITGDRETLSLRPVDTCYHMTSMAPDRFRHATLYLPLSPYAENDREAHNRIRGYLSGRGLPAEVYSRCAEVFSDGTLERGQGFHSFVSYQRGIGPPRITVYFNPRVYYPRYGWLALAPERCWPSPAGA